MRASPRDTHKLTIGRLVLFTTSTTVPPRLRPGALVCLLFVLAFSSRRLDDYKQSIRA